MDLLYVAILLALFGLISALAVGCARLQIRTAAPRPPVSTRDPAPTALPDPGTLP